MDINADTPKKEHCLLAGAIFVGCLALAAFLEPFGTGMCFPYSQIIVRLSAYNGRAILPEDVGHSLDFAQWSLLMVAFAWFTRRVPRLYLVPIAGASVLLVIFGVASLLLVFGIGINGWLSVAKIPNKPEVALSIIGATIAIHAALLAIMIRANRNPKRKKPNQPPEPTAPSGRGSS